MQSGWRVGSLFGIPFYIDSSWLLILLFVTLAYGSDPTWQGAMGPWAWVAALALALLLFLSVVLHELGHSLAARLQGIKVNSITLFLFGGIAAIDRESKTPGQAFQVAIAGPLVSFGLFLGLLALGAVIPLPLVSKFILFNVAQTNLVLTLFNLIPGLPLDGGQVLKAAVWKVTGSRSKGVRWAARTGQVLGWGAIILGVLAYLTAQRLDLLWIALIGWFAVRNAAAYRQMTDLQDAIAELHAGDAMVREYRVVDADMTLRQFADDYLLQEGRLPTYFAASDGRYRGVVSPDELRNLERSEWDTTTLNAIAHPLNSIPSVREQTPLYQVITTLEDQALPRITVLTPADAVAGTLDRGDIVRAIAQKMNVMLPEALIKRIKEEGTYPPGLNLVSLAQTVSE